MEHFLISIIPSEDITIEIRDLRTSIFKKFGIISSRCLPEMIPIAFIDKKIDKQLFQGLSLSLEMTSSNCISTDSNDIFLQIDNTDFINNIQKKISNNISSGFISIESGIYLGSAEKHLDVTEIISFIHMEKEKTLSWKKNNLELIRINVYNEVWWENIQWETIWTQKIRRA